MANEGIRLPSDTTVASQKVQRGHGLPETKALPQQNKEAMQVSPLLTVVLQSRTLIEGKNQSLYELVLQNDPKSAPPIRLQADTQIKPGTSLLLELDENAQYRPVDKPTSEQLKQLVKLELEFWRAHLLPKAGNQSLPSLPSTELLTALAKTTPELAPLIRWITQQPSKLSGNIIAQWLKEATPLSLLRTWAPAISLAHNANDNRPNPANLQRLFESPLLSSINSKQTLATQPVLVSDPRLSIPVGKSTLSFVDVIQKTGLLLPNVLTQLTSPKPEGAAQATTLNTLANQTTILSRLLAQAIDQTSTTTGPKLNDATNGGLPPKVALKFLGQLFSVPAQSNRPTTSKALHFGYISTRPTQAMSENLTNAIMKQGIATTSINSTSEPKPIPVIPALSLSTGTTVHTGVNQPNQQGASSATLTSTNPSIPTQNSSLPLSETQIPSVKVQHTAAVTEAAKLNSSIAIATAAKYAGIANHQTLATPEAASTQQTALPLEIKLGQWLTEIDKHITQNPVHAQMQLKNRASELLRQLTDGATKVSANPLLDSEKKPTDKEEPTLLALRNWIDSAQARIQHAAVQTTAAQWSAPDIPVNQMQLPLIWLGLTSWADIEWWQEKPKKKDSSKKDQEERRRWRMKIYLSLSPLADMCADIDWSTSGTNITFWSEDPATLKQLGQLMPALHSWTEGLGEKSLNTKHGMPKRRTQSDKAQTEQHLVDIRT